MDYFDPANDNSFMVLQKIRNGFRPPYKYPFSAFVVTVQPSMRYQRTGFTLTYPVNTAGIMDY